MCRQPSLTAFMTICLFSIQPSMANPACGEQITGEAYYEIEKRSYTLNDEQEDELKSLSKRLSGDWRGELVQIECKGTVDHPIKLIDSSTVRLEIKSHSKKRLNLHADLDFREQNKKVIYQRRIFERRDIDSFLSNGPDILILTEKSYQNLQFSRGTVLVETIYKVLIDQNTLHLDIITFTNGFFSIEERWILSRW